MPKNRFLLMVHGHFYQPPRENPWTGRIDPQPSASPWDDWNRRIAAECYLPMGRSRVYGAGGGIVDLRNNYSRISFNFGPTLLAWAEKEAPDIIRDAGAAARANPASALAQSYSHSILPLCDARDKHTQIAWGLKEFHARFGAFPEGMWLPECGIDNETVRALIDHRVKFVILSPHQASRVRPFGEADWRDAAMGAIDTRRSYRLFEIDGGGRTHFDRGLDVIFYTPGLNLKISFDHLLARPDDLVRELRACYDPDRPEVQIASIVTDGEIYGHHEKDGQEALTRLIDAIAPAHGFTVVSAGECLGLAPPSWEVKLWSGEDKMGTSWSCPHGVGRWFRDCGCRLQDLPGRDQAWRRPLRNAFDDLRSRARAIVRGEIGPLFRDVLEARDDYIRVVLRPDAKTRAAFLDRHARRRLTAEEIGRVWALFEADRNAMLMYASCGWFFDELSGIEPVQNMRYALRAAELLQPYADEDLIALLRNRLASAKSSLPRFGDGGDVFDRLAAADRRGDAAILAAIAACQAAEIPPGGTAWKTLPQSLVRRDGRGRAWGRLVAKDEILDRTLACAWFVSLADHDSSGVILRELAVRQNTPYDQSPPPETDDMPAWAEGLSGVPESELSEIVRRDGIAVHQLPAREAGALHRLASAKRLRDHLERSADLGTSAIAIWRAGRRHGDEPPDPIPAEAVFAVEHRVEAVIRDAIADLRFDDAALRAVNEARRPAEELDFRAAPDRPARRLALAFGEFLHLLGKSPAPGWLRDLPTRTLDGGAEWSLPSDRMNAIRSHPDASPFALALGKGLASARRLLLKADPPGPAALTLLPLPELLAFARRGGFMFPPDVGAHRAFWDFLNGPLADLAASDPSGIAAGEPGDRLRRIGAELGFAEETLDRRLAAAVERALS
ncbi:MAG: DUF3536 domain-containing protein [Planctomycetota bacterium]|jgi:hypothetical protein|nr:DUF3536 domain-containing protein [Planctomycetota bacterium]